MVSEKSFSFLTSQLGVFLDVCGFNKHSFKMHFYIDLFYLGAVHTCTTPYVQMPPDDLTESFSTTWIRGIKLRWPDLVASSYLYLMSHLDGPDMESLEYAFLVPSLNSGFMLEMEWVLCAQLWRELMNKVCSYITV